MYHHLWTKETALHCFFLISGVARTQTGGTGTWEHSYPNIWSASQVYFIDFYYGICISLCLGKRILGKILLHFILLDSLE